MQLKEQVLISASILSFQILLCPVQEVPGPRVRHVDQAGAVPQPAVQVPEEGSVVGPRQSLPQATPPDLQLSSAQPRLRMSLPHVRGHQDEAATGIAQTGKNWK